MREGMQGKVGIGKLALYGREYLVAVTPQLWTLMLYTLHHAAEIRPVDAIEDLNAVTKKVKPAEVKLARQVMAALSAPAGAALDLTDFQDEYQAGLFKIITAKIAGQEIVESPPIETPPMMPTMEALLKSLAAVSATKKLPATVPTPAKRKRA